MKPVSPEGYGAGLDTRFLNLGSSAIALHEKDLPLRCIGLGSRRLAALALQHAAVPDGGIALVDEIEHGLEPHRIRWVLSCLGFIDNVVKRDTEGPNNTNTELGGQVITVTHSPVVVTELNCTNIRIVRNNSPEITVLEVPEILQSAVRASASALLSRKIIVCEGRTELGLIRGLDVWWAKRNGGLTLGYQGVGLVDGSGRTGGPSYAVGLADLGYEVSYFGDSDEPLDSSDSVLRDRGITVVLWDGTLSTEERIALDLPQATAREFFDSAVAFAVRDSEVSAQNSVWDSVKAQLAISENSPKGDIHEWTDWDTEEQQKFRVALGKAAKKKKWFKNIDGGEKLAEIVGPVLPQIESTDLARKLNELERWVHAG